MENTKNKETEPTFLKIIYFDESAAQDYLDITNGGRLDWSKEDNRKRAAEILTEIEAQAKGGFNILNFIKGSMSGNIDAKASGEISKLFDSTIKNTLLTDYIKEAYKVLNAAVDAGQTSLNFSDTPEAYVNADVTQDDPALQSALEACNNYTKASITYTFGSQTTTLNGDTIKDWLQFDEKGQLIWDDNSFQQHVADYVAQLAATYDTVGTEREFQTTSGRTVYVSSSVYGWKIDQAAEAAQLSQEIQSGTQTTREPVYSQTANSYGVNDLGDTYIEVDLSEQHMYYYQNGSDIFESDFVSGNMSYADRQTHAGIFTLYYKKSPDVLRGTMKADGTYEYESEVQYWMPFDGGIGFHDASWRDEFGGDIYLTGGSHGCINLPPDNAAVLYDIIQYGVPIVCFY